MTDTYPSHERCILFISDNAEYNIMATLVIHWGRGTKSEVERTKNQIEFGLGGRKKLNKQEIAMCKELHPDVVILMSYQIGGIGFDKRIRYVTEWAMDYKSKCAIPRDSLFNAGVKTVDLPKDKIPESHFLLLGQMSIELFELSASRFKGIRLWGERHIDSSEMIHLARFEREGREFNVVYSNPLEAELAVMVSKVYPDSLEMSIISVEEYAPRQAFKIAPSGVSGPTALIELARENSDKIRRKLFRLLKDIWSGQQALRQIHKLTKMDVDFIFNDELRKIWKEFEKTKIEFPKL